MNIVAQGMDNIMNIVRFITVIDCLFHDFQQKVLPANGALSMSSHMFESYNLVASTMHPAAGSKKQAEEAPPRPKSNKGTAHDSPPLISL